MFGQFDWCGTVFFTQKLGPTKDYGVRDPECQPKPTHIPESFEKFLGNYVDEPEGTGLHKYTKPLVSAGGSEPDPSAKARHAQAMIR